MVNAAPNDMYSLIDYNDDDSELLLDVILQCER